MEEYSEGPLLVEEGDAFVADGLGDLEEVGIVPLAPVAAGGAEGGGEAVDHVADLGR